MGGENLLLRWRRKASEWKVFPDCPPPQFMTRHRKIWFVDKQSLRCWNFEQDQWSTSFPAELCTTNDFDLNSFSIFDVTPEGELFALTKKELESHTGIIFVHDYCWDTSGILHITGNDGNGRGD